MRQLSLLQYLKYYITQKGYIQTTRVSSAQASGNAKNFSYWGAVRYEIRLDKKNKHPINCSLERATSDRRSIRLAQEDCNNICDKEGRIQIQTIGKLSEIDVNKILLDLGILYA